MVPFQLKVKWWSTDWWSHIKYPQEKWPKKQKTQSQFKKTVINTGKSPLCYTIVLLSPTLSTNWKTKRTQQHFHDIHEWGIVLLQSVHIAQCEVSGVGPGFLSDCQIHTELIPGKLSKDPSTGTRLMKPTATGKKPLLTRQEWRGNKVWIQD